VTAIPSCRRSTWPAACRFRALLTNLGDAQE
jgi:hypothetical protein